MKIGKIGLIFILMQFSLFFSAAQASEGDHCGVKDFNLNIEATGVALLCETPGGLYGLASVQDLIPGNAYTAWWVYFDDAANCATPNSCGGPETAGENPIAVFGRLDSFIAPESGDVLFQGIMRDFRANAGSQISILMIDHGMADMDDTRGLARQLLTPEIPGFGAPHLGNNVDGALGTVIGAAQFIIR